MIQNLIWGLHDPATLKLTPQERKKMRTPSQTQTQFINLKVMLVKPQKPIQAEILEHSCDIMSTEEVKSDELEGKSMGEKIKSITT